MPATLSKQAHTVPMGDPAAKAKALKILLGSIIGGGALGFGATGLSGLLQMRNRQIPTTPEPTEVEIPSPIKAGAAPDGGPPFEWYSSHGPSDETTEIRPKLHTNIPALGGDSLAEDAGVGQKLKDLFSEPAAPAALAAPAAPAAPGIERFSLPWLRGDAAKSPMGVPWMLPGAIGGGLLAMHGGSQLAQHLIHKRMKAKQEAELSEAQKAYDHALTGQMHKKADDLAGLATGAGVGAMGLLALLSARGAYSHAHGRSEEALLRQAIQNKSYLQSLREPPAIRVMPAQAEPDVEP